MVQPTRLLAMVHPMRTRPRSLTRAGASAGARAAAAAAAGAGAHRSSPTSDRPHPRAAHPVALATATWPPQSAWPQPRPAGPQPTGDQPLTQPWAETSPWPALGALSREPRQAPPAALENPGVEHPSWVRGCAPMSGAPREWSTKEWPPSAAPAPCPRPHPSWPRTRPVMAAPAPAAPASALVMAAHAPAPPRAPAPVRGEAWVLLL
jgi:hypothetical protein